MKTRLLDVELALCKLRGMHELTPTRLSNAVGISVPYASQILTTARTPARPLALRIYREFGLKLGPIAHLSDEDIETLARIEGLAA